MGSLLTPSQGGSRVRVCWGGGWGCQVQIDVINAINRKIVLHVWGNGPRGCCYYGGQMRHSSDGRHDARSLSKKEITMYFIDMANINRRPRSPAKGMHYTTHYTKYEELTCNQKKKPRKMFSCFILSFSTSLSFS